jgi:endonuclease/exonuclease/phosphatase family metal-dependent hydrolase
LRADAVLTAATLAHALLTLAFTLGLRCIGEASVLTTIALYLPRWPLGLPLPVLVLALAWRRRRWLLGLELLTGLCWLFPLLGLRFGVARAPTPGRHLLRVLSFNVEADVRVPPLLSALRTAKADLIVLQEGGDENAAFWKTELRDYEWAVRDQFVLGSRFPIVEVSPAFQEGAAYVRFRLELPEGPMHLYALHPPSPRLSMSEALDHGVPLRPSRLERVAADIAANTSDRARQLRVITDDARSSSLPVLIAGDTNLPDLSPVLAGSFRGFQDGFAEVGRGFGYTFPVGGHWLGPWMRIDRVFVSHAFRVLDVITLPPAGSDHLPVLAVLEW